MHIVVGRHFGELGDHTAANPSRPQLRNFRLSLLDYRYRRFLPAGQYTSADYHELLIRWFQFGTFCPIFRIHGYQSKTEMLGVALLKCGLHRCAMQTELANSIGNCFGGTEDKGSERTLAG